KDDDELQLVMNYVKDQLAQLGIRFPKLYPVSSKKALKAKQNNQNIDEKMLQFEDVFYQFIHEDLSRITVQSALIDIKRATQSVIDYIQSASFNEQEKETYRADL